MSFTRTGKEPTDHPVPYVEKIGEGNPSYMIRCHLTPFKWWPWRRVYLHVLGRPDKDREYHDHPWSFWTIILWGGYTEKSHILNDDGTPTGVYADDKLGWLSVRFRPATHAHKITKLHTKRVITLVLRSNQKDRDWGFWCKKRQDEDGKKIPASRQPWIWVPWRQYHGEI